MEDMGNPEGNEIIFQDLVSRYGESHRFYHVLAHIVSMLNEFEEVTHLAGNSIAVRLAIWYHDAIYDTAEKLPHPTSNEERSALLAQEELEYLGQDSKIVGHVVIHVLATEHTFGGYSPDTRLLLDLDLAIFGKSDEEFDEFDRNIRKEYARVPEIIYRSGRIKILRMFLDREKLYLTTTLAEKYDKKARENLKRAIARLES